MFPTEVAYATDTMRYSMLNLLACPEQRTPLVLVATREIEGRAAHVRMSTALRVNAAGQAVGPLPEGVSGPLAALLGRYAAKGDPSRNDEVRVEEGLLVSPETGRWFPIRNFIPELLPDHLRDWTADRAFLDHLRPALPGDLHEALAAGAFGAPASRSDAGQHHKVAEMTITEKVGNTPGFFGPGYVAPFNPGSAEHTIHLIRMFGFCMPLLGNGTRRLVLDSGCGYAWTTDWMWRAGLEPIGLDISRVYLDIAVTRLGHNLPYVMVADTEYLPIADGALEAVLGFDAFHHIPNRPRAMQEFARTLQPGGVIVLAEPSTAHDTVPAVVEVAERYGTLEKGMDLRDVQQYVAGSGLEPPIQHYILDVPHVDLDGQPPAARPPASRWQRAWAALHTSTPDADVLPHTTRVDATFVTRHSFNPANLFTIRKPQ